MAVEALSAERNSAAEQEKARAEGKYLGLGLACYVEGTGLGPYEGGHIRIHPITGKVYVNTGLSGQGQGHDTVFAQIVADQVGVSPADVIVVEGDTKAFDWGVATFASRAAVVSGNAIHKTAVTVRQKMLEAAANMLEVDIDEVDLHDSAAWVKGSNRFVPLAAIATASNPLRYAFNEAAQAATQFAPGEQARRAAARRRGRRRASKRPSITARRHRPGPTACMPRSSRSIRNCARSRSGSTSASTTAAT